MVVLVITPVRSLGRIEPGDGDGGTGQVREISRPPGQKGVDDVNCGGPAYERVDQMRTNEPGAAGDEDSLHFTNPGREDGPNRDRRRSVCIAPRGLADNRWTSLSTRR